MSQEIEVVEEMVDEGNAFLTMVRRIVLAGIGAVAVAQEEAEEFVHKLVERGEIAEKDGRKLLNDISERRKKAQDGVQDRAQTTIDGLDSRMEGLLDRLNVPTKSDIEALSEKVALLAEKVDALGAKRNGNDKTE